MPAYVDLKTKEVKQLTNAELSAVLGESPREARERVWLSQPRVEVPIEMNTDDYKVIVSPTFSLPIYPESKHYQIFVMHKKDGDYLVADWGLIDNSGWWPASFDTQQDAIDAYLAASPKHSQPREHQALVRQMA